MTYFRIYVGGRYKCHILALDEFDARSRFAKRCGIDIGLVSATELITEESQS